MNIKEEDLQKMIRNGLHKAFSQNGQFGTDGTENFISLMNAKNMVETEDEENEDGETTEAMGAGASGAFSAPLFSEPKKNNLFQPGTESKLTTKPEGGPVNEDEIKGGKADGMDIEDIAELHGLTVDDMYDEFTNGVHHEMEHTSEMMVAIEIALDHLYEDPYYYSKLDSIEKKGGETTEVTSSSSAGVYDMPFGSPKKDPLKLSNPDTVEKELRSVRDKNFPKYGGKGAKFVKVKKKCSKFPYCNQGDINALQLFERDIVKEMVTRTAKTAKVEEYVIRNIIAKELGYIQEQEDGEYVTFEFPDDYKPKSAEEHRKEWMDSIKDKRAKFLIDKFEGKEIEFKGKDLTGKIKIISIGPSDAYLGFASSADDYNFENGDGVKIVYDLIDLYYKGDKVPNGFYSMMSRYLPPEEEEDSYRGDPVEYAVMGGLDEIISALKYMGLRFEKAEINPWSHY